jgi:lactate permease
MDFLLASIPLAVFFALILFFKKTALYSSLISLGVMVVIGLNWGMDMNRILSAGSKGAFLATEIILIIFGALLILELLKVKNYLSAFRKIFASVSDDKRVYVILIAWGLVYFLEGAAGFGTPAMIAVPIFLSLGFAPLAAVVLSLIGDSVPVIFGAIGLPVTYGITSPLLSLGASPEMVGQISITAAGLNILGSVIIPAILLFVFAKIERKPLKYFFEFLPFSIVAGLSASLASFFTAYSFGPELPAVIGGLAAIAVVILMAKFKIFTTAGITETQKGKLAGAELQSEKPRFLKILFPYAILVAILIVTRAPFLPIKEWLTNFCPVKIQSLFGQAISYTFPPLYSAGVILIIVAVISFAVLRVKKNEIFGVIKTSFKKALFPYFTLVSILALVQIFVYSGDNALNLPSMPIVLAGGISSVFGGVWPLLAPFVGAFGAFVAGSATVSNLIFSGFQYQTAMATGFNPALILSLQGIGAAGGNMIAIHNIVAALAVAGLSGVERLVIRKNLPSLLIYLSVIALVSFFVIQLAGL